MKRWTMITNRSIKMSLLSLALTGLVGCGADLPWEGNSDDGGNKEGDADRASAALACGESAHDNEVTQIRLKDLSTMIASVTQVWGSLAVKDVTDKNKIIFKQFENVYPKKDSSDLAADILSDQDKAVGLIMAQVVIAKNIANHALANPNNPLYQCDTPETAARMLNAALPFVRSCDDSELTVDFAALCKEDQAGAISSLAGSVAFMMRN